jgi:chromosome partitioning protein
VKEIAQDHNADLSVEGIVVNQFQPRATLPKKLVDELVDEGLPVLASRLSSSVKIRESHQQAKPVIHLDPAHKITREFVALHQELSG